LSAPGRLHCGIYVGPRGASGFVSGFVVRHASKATLKSGRNLRSASRMAVLSSAMKAENQSSKVDES
jgi:hypothetical protein